MTGDALSGQIGKLVDNLRKQNTAALSLTDVASVTEVLIATTQLFFKSIDTSIYHECRSLSDYISNARKEIASLQPGDLESDRIPRAGLELDAIVQQTEEATNTIMEAAEEIMGADPANPEAYHSVTQDAVMRIFEACSFQDITGQRISKVVETLAHIENRVLELRNLLGVTEDDIDEAKANAEPAEVSHDEALLSGPALDGEGIDQSEVDALMSGGAVAQPAAVAEPVAAATPTPEPKPEPVPEPVIEAPKPVNPKKLDNMFAEDFDPVADAAAAEEAKKAKKKATEKAIEKAEENPDAQVSQDDIDALFG